MTKISNMSKEPRQDLEDLINALQRHFEMAVSLDGAEDSPLLSEAEANLRDAFFTYDDSLFTATGAELPFDIIGDEDDDDDDEDDDDDDEDYDEDLFERNRDYLDEDEIEGFDLHADD